MKRLLIIAALLLIPAFALGAETYYVRTGGLDSHSCVQAQTDNDANAKLTISSAIGCTSAADTDIVIVHGGTYNENIANALAIPAGSSFANALTIRPATGETVTQTGGSWHFNSGENYVILGHSAGTWILDGTGIDDDGVNVGASVHHIRVTYLTIRNFGSPSANVYMSAGLHTGPSTGGFNEFLNNTIYSNGFDSQDHGIYVADDDNLIEGNTVYSNSGYGITVYGYPPNGPDRNIVRRNTVYNNGTGGWGCGIGVGGGTGHQVYNNIAYRTTATQECGINVEFQSVTNALVYNNSVYNTGTGILVGGTSTGAILRNNITWGNATNIWNNGSGTICSNNLGLTVSGCVTAASASSPFTNAGAADFTLAAGSLAIGAGVDLSSVFTTDFTGATRTVPWTIGAYIGPVAATLTLLNPNGGTLGAVSTAQTFTWGFTDAVAVPNVKLEYDAANDAVFETTISASTPNDGAFDFTAAAVATTTGRFKVSDAADGSPSDTSDANVTITAGAGGSGTVIISDNTSGTRIGDISGTTNSLLSESVPTFNYGAGSGVRANKFAAAEHSHSVVKFPTAAIPADATVTAAELGFYLTAFTGAGTPSIDFRRNMRAFVQTQATWNIYSTGNSWTTAGGLGAATDRASAVSCNLSVSATTFQYYTCSHADLVTLVQSWVNLSVANEGFHLERNGTGNDGLLRTFASNTGDSAQRPYLSVTYTTTAATITVTQPVSGAHWFPDPNRPVGLRWDSTGLSGNVKVEISRNNGVSYDATPIVASHPFDQADATWAVAGPACTQCIVKVTSLNNAAVFGLSPAFKIAGSYMGIK